jgi:hypothetical protein
MEIKYFMQKLLTKENLKNFKYSQDESTKEMIDCIKKIKKDDTCDEKSKEYKIKYLINLMIHELT